VAAAGWVKTGGRLVKHASYYWLLLLQNLGRGGKPGEILSH
jgi:hypothetical protein